MGSVVLNHPLRYLAQDRNGLLNLPVYWLTMQSISVFTTVEVPITIEFWKVTGDPLARALRNRFKREKQFPKRKFQCVYSDELLENKKPVDPNDRGNGSLVHITAVFGFILSGLVLQDAVSAVTR